MEILQDERKLDFKFNGNASEYFKIWIVNIALTIITLGIYSAWAKVRTKRYFYGNTTLDGSSFEYLADPLNILKGRLILLAVVVVYIFATQFMPMLEAAFILLYIVALPWMVVKSMQFNARNSSYRNVRFDFDGSMLQAALVLFGAGLLVLLTLGLATPYFVKRFKQFSIEHSYFGITPFSFGASTGDFYRIYLKAILIPMLIMAIFGIVAAIVIPAYQSYNVSQQLPAPMQQEQPMTPEQQQAEMQRTIDEITANANMQGQAQQSPEAKEYEEMAKIVAMFVTIITMVFYLLIGIYIQTRIANLVLCSISLDKHQLVSTLRVRNMFYLHLTNIIAAIISLGLLIPWCKIRLTRYRLQNLSLIAHGDINSFIASERENVKATAGEFADAFDLDMGF